MSQASRGSSIPVTIEKGEKKFFASAVHWPGWSRPGKDEASALENLARYVPRYAAVAKRAGLRFPEDAEERLEVTERVGGSSGTDFGVPGQVSPSDREAVSSAEAERMTALLEASWATFDEVAAGAPPSLRKGPRGGGRDRDKMIGHLVEADHAYAREMGIKTTAPDPRDRASVKAMREEMLGVLRKASDGSPLAGRRWPPRYAARRVAWHALDHAWEMEDRS